MMMMIRATISSNRFAAPAVSEAEEEEEAAAMAAVGYEIKLDESLRETEKDKRT